MGVVEGRNRMGERLRVFVLVSGQERQLAVDRGRELRVRVCSQLTTPRAYVGKLPAPGKCCVGQDAHAQWLGLRDWDAEGAPFRTYGPLSDVWVPARMVRLLD